MRNNRTDLAMECTAGLSKPIHGLEVRSCCQGAAETTFVRVLTPEASKRLGKAPGEYWTLQHPCMAGAPPEERMRLAGMTAAELRRLLPDEGEVLVVGLGNRYMTADALGSRTVERIFVTRHLEQKGVRRLRSVSAMAPGVLGITGVETAEMVHGVVERTKPTAVIAVDALAAMDTDRICTTIQVANTGIQPGSGVGNHRAGLTLETLGIPVIAVGIPMVVYASVIARDALKQILRRDSEEEQAELMAEQLARDLLGEMVVTPRNIDELVLHLADTLALAINAALQSEFTLDELSRRLH